MVWQGLHAIKLTRKLVEALSLLLLMSDYSGDFVLDSYQLSDADGRAIRNLVHASGSIEEAIKKLIYGLSKMK